VGRRRLSRLADALLLHARALADARDLGRERAAADSSGGEAGLASLLSRLRPSGAITYWGFGDDEFAFTHTIAYTLRGILECSRILDAWDDVGRCAVPALERMLRKTELSGGRLAAQYDYEWRPLGTYECLTGAAQTAINLLLWERQQPDLRIVNGAAKLVDRVCATQSLGQAIPGIRGAVAGSWPVWGRYLMFRYPNWAAKYHCDALSALMARIESEFSRLKCGSS
jgi:hypothetical protein